MMLLIDVHAKNTSVNEDYIKSPKGNIYIRTEGSGHPVVMINGGPGAGHTIFLGWFDFLKTQGYQLVFFDDIGRGRSTRNIEGKFTPQMTVDDIESVRKYLGADKITLMAHSYGGIPAMQYALQHTPHVEKLIMLNASYDTKSQQMNSNQYYHLIRTRYPEKWSQLKALKAKGVKSSDEEYADIAYGEFIDWYQWFDVKNRSKNRKFPSTDKRDYFNFQVFEDIIDPHYGQIRGTLLGIDIKEQVKDFNIPTLITSGRYDNASTPELVYRLYEMLPKDIASYKSFEQSGHWPWVEETQKFEEVVSHFLNESRL
jgi:proline iminopeptidase